MVTQVIHINTCDRCGKDESDKTGPVLPTRLEFDDRTGEPEICRNCVSDLKKAMDKGKFTPLTKGRRGRKRKVLADL